MGAIQQALNDDRGTFGRPPSAESMDKILDAAEYAANLLEAAQDVPMDVPPTAKILYWREQPPEKRDREATANSHTNLGSNCKRIRSFISSRRRKRCTRTCQTLALSRETWLAFDSMAAATASVRRGSTISHDAAPIRQSAAATPNDAFHP